MMARLALVMVCVLGAGCVQDQEIAATETLAAGLTALADGDHETALHACRRSARTLRNDRSALECWLLSAVALQRLDAAGKAAARLANAFPEDAWYRAVRTELLTRLDDRHVPDDELEGLPGVWACLSGRCRAEQLPDSDVLWLNALVRGVTGERKNVLEMTMPQRCASGFRRLRLQVLISLGDVGAIEKELLACPCRADPDGGVAAVLAHALGYRAYFEQEGCAAARPEGVGRLSASAAGELDGGIRALREGRLRVAEDRLLRAHKLARDDTLPTLYLYLVHLLQRDERAARTRLLALQNQVSAEWFDWLVALAPDPLL